MATDPRTMDELREGIRLRDEKIFALVAERDALAERIARACELAHDSGTKYFRPEIAFFLEGKDNGYG